MPDHVHILMRLLKEWTLSLWMKCLMSFVSVPNNSILKATPTLSTHFHKYGDVCWERDGAQIEARLLLSSRPLLASPIRKRHRIYEREY